MFDGGMSLTSFNFGRREIFSLMFAPYLKNIL